MPEKTLNPSNYTNLMMDDNIVRVPRPSTPHPSQAQESVYLILDYIETLENHIALGNTLWLKKFIREYKDAMVGTPAHDLLSSFKSPTSSRSKKISTPTPTPTFASVPTHSTIIQEES